MENYIGVKIVKAEPQEKNGVPGYRVKYPDGYVSWSPKATLRRRIGNWTVRILSILRNKSMMRQVLKMVEICRILW